MSDGGAQFIKFAYSHLPNLKVYHYEPGGLVAKTVWTDEAKTTPAAQPVVGDVNGVVSFYADGDYRFIIKDEGDVQKYDYDDVKVTSDTATMWEGNFGTSFPAASADNKWHQFLKHDVTDTYYNFGINNGSAFQSFVEKKSDGTFTLFDQIMPTVRVIDVKNYGATGDGVTDDTTAIQNAINAVSATGDAVYFPRGIYILTSTLTHVNDPIKIFGDGKEVSVLRWTSAGGIDIDFNGTTDNVTICGLTLETSVVGAGDAINVTWPVGSSLRSNAAIYDVQIAPTNADAATAYWTNGIVLEECQNAAIYNVWYRGKTNDFSSVSGITLKGFSARCNISGVHVLYCDDAILIQGTGTQTVISNCIINYTNRGIYYNFGSTVRYHKVIDCHMETFKNGILAENATRVILAANGMVKHASSANNYIGIGLDSSSEHCIVAGNQIKNNGSAGGTEDGIKVINGDRVIITNNIIEDVDTNAIWTAASATNCRINGNLIDNAGTAYKDDGTGNIFLDRYTDGTVIIASATTITLPPNGEAFGLSGSTDVANITASWIGRNIVLYKSDASAMTMLGSGNLRNSGGGGRTMDEYNTIGYVWDGTDWLEVSWVNNA